MDKCSNKRCPRCVVTHWSQMPTDPGRCLGCDHAWSCHSQYGCGVKVGSASCDDAYCDCSRRPLALITVLRECARERMIANRPCEEHPRYQAKRAPRGTCQTCWKIWCALQEEP